MTEFEELQARVSDLEEAVAAHAQALRRFIENPESPHHAAELAAEELSPPTEG